MKMQNMVYLPHLNRAHIVKAYRFESPRFGPHCGVLLTDCESASPVRYVHVLVVDQGVEIFGAQCFAVASEINKNAPPDSPRSHFLGVFPGVLGSALHENLGAAHAWADLASFEQKALAIIVERFGLTQPPQELPTTAEMTRRYHFPQLHAFARDAQPLDPASHPPASKQWWQFWKKE
jgi:hypothetical protein